MSIETPLKPLSLYAGAKSATYLMLSQWLPKQTVEFAWCRLFYLYGEGEDVQRLVPYLRAKLAAGEIAELTSGNQIRDFMDVSEAVDSRKSIRAFLETPVDDALINEYNSTKEKRAQNRRIKIVFSPS